MRSSDRVSKASGITTTYNLLLAAFPPAHPHPLQAIPQLPQKSYVPATSLMDFRAEEVQGGKKNTKLAVHSAVRKTQRGASVFPLWAGKSEVLSCGVVERFVIKSEEKK